jgi:uncharacterized membrane protein
MWRVLINTRRDMDELIENAEKTHSAFEIKMYRNQLDELDNILEKIKNLPQDFNWNEK